MCTFSATTEVQRLLVLFDRLVTAPDDLLNDMVVPTTSLTCPLDKSCTVYGIRFKRSCLEDLIHVKSVINTSVYGEPVPGPSDTFLQARDKAVALYIGFLEVLYIHFFFLPTECESLSTLIKWCSLALDDRLEEWYKTQSCYLFSMVTQQKKIVSEMPDIPSWITDEPGFLQGGKLYRIASHAIYKGADIDEIRAFYALMNVKRAGLAISEKKQEASLLKHIKNMTGAEFKPRLSYNLPMTFQRPARIEARQPEEVLEDILTKLDQLLELDFGGGRGLRCNSAWRVPSVNACYEFAKGKCGSHQLFHENHVSRIISPTFIGYAHYRTKVVEVYVPYLPQEMFADLQSDIVEEYGVRLDPLFGEYELPVRVPEATVHKVLEPFKCRIITAGPGKLYQAGRCIQKPIHDIMRKNALFHLTGAPADKYFIFDRYSGVELVSNETDFLEHRKKFSFFVAGDYSAATDGMHPKISRRFCETLFLCGFLNRTEYLTAKTCMSGHKLFYPSLDDKYKKIPNQMAQYFHNGEFVQQTWGQLMGSPISFPILCYANAAVNWVAAEYYLGRYVKHEEWVSTFRPIFNGDDTAFVSNPLHYDIWKNVASCAGLNSSLGKSYCSKEFIMINSELFRPIVDSGFVTGIEDVFVLNPGLVKGQAKVMDDSRKGDYKFNVSKNTTKLDGEYKNTPFTELLPLVDQLAMATRKSSPFEAYLVKNLFIDHVKGKLKKTNRPWSAPRFLGGLGLDGIGHMTYSQRLACTMIMCATPEQYKTLFGGKDPKELTGFKREKPDYANIAFNHASYLMKKLGVEYELWGVREQKSLRREDILAFESSVGIEFDIPEEGKELSLDLYHLGDEVEEVGDDGYSKLLKLSLSNAHWLHNRQISDKRISEYCNKCEYYSSEVKGSVILG